jgi:hypothetical protein
MTDSEAEEKALQAKMEELSGHMFTVMWHITEIDLRATLNAVCRKVVIIFNCFFHNYIFN